MMLLIAVLLLEFAKMSHIFIDKHWFEWKRGQLQNLKIIFFILYKRWIKILNKYLKLKNVNFTILNTQST